MRHVGSARCVEALGERGRSISMRVCVREKEGKRGRER